MTQDELTTGVEDRHEAAREVIRQLEIGQSWKGVMDPDMPPALTQISSDMLDAYERADLDWLLEHCDPELEISQPPEIPGARTYRGKDGLIEALLDWPRQWEDFRVEPRRIFAAGHDHMLFDAIHHGRPHSVDIEVEAEIVFVTQWRDGLLARWDMFLTIDDALESVRSDPAPE